MLGERAYYPAGALRAQHGHMGSLGFTGQRHDPVSGLIRFRFRALDGRLARWQSPDPLFERSSATALQEVGQATTAYAYVGNRLVNSVDPTGLMGQALSSCTKPGGVAVPPAKPAGVTVPPAKPRGVTFPEQPTTAVHEIPARSQGGQPSLGMLTSGDHQRLALAYTYMRSFVTGPDGRRQRVLDFSDRPGGPSQTRPIVGRRTTPTGVDAFARRLRRGETHLSPTARALLWSEEGRERLFYEAASDDTSSDGMPETPVENETPVVSEGAGGGSQ